MFVYKISEQDRLTILERIKNFRLMDDDFMTKCFEGQIAATELIVNTILNVEWRVQSVQTQETIKNLQGRSLRLDIHAVTADGQQVNIEIQRQDKGAAAKRARYHSSILDANTLLAGEGYDKLPDTYVIFITENDVLGYGEPIYFIERYIKDKNAPFSDGAHIVYVNNAISGDTPLGKLMHDFVCTNPEDMYYQILADRVKYFKNNEREKIGMGRAIEELCEEIAQRIAQRVAKEEAQKVEQRTEQKTARRIAETLINIGEMSLDSIATAVQIPLEEIQEMARKLQPQKFA